MEVEIGGGVMVMEVMVMEVMMVKVMVEKSYGSGGDGEGDG